MLLRLAGAFLVSGALAAPAPVREEDKIAKMSNMSLTSACRNETKWPGGSISLLPDQSSGPGLLGWASNGDTRSSLSLPCMPKSDHNVTLIKYQEEQAVVTNDTLTEDSEPPSKGLNITCAPVLDFEMLIQVFEAEGGPCDQIFNSTSTSEENALPTLPIVEGMDSVSNATNMEETNSGANVTDVESTNSSAVVPIVEESGGADAKYAAIFDLIRSATNFVYMPAPLQELKLDLVNKSLEAIAVLSNPLAGLSEISGGETGAEAALLPEYEYEGNSTDPYLAYKMGAIMDYLNKTQNASLALAEEVDREMSKAFPGLAVNLTTMYQEVTYFIGNVTEKKIQAIVGSSGPGPTGTGEPVSSDAQSSAETTLPAATNPETSTSTEDLNSTETLSSDTSSESGSPSSGSFTEEMSSTDSVQSMDDPIPTSSPTDTPFNDSSSTELPTDSDLQPSTSGSTSSGTGERSPTTTSGDAPISSIPSADEPSMDEDLPTPTSEPTVSETGGGDPTSTSSDAPVSSPTNEEVVVDTTSTDLAPIFPTPSSDETTADKDLPASISESTLPGTSEGNPVNTSNDPPVSSPTLSTSEDETVDTTSTDPLTSPTPPSSNESTAERNMPTSAGEITSPGTGDNSPISTDTPNSPSPSEEVDLDAPLTSSNPLPETSDVPGTPTADNGEIDDDVIDDEATGTAITSSLPTTGISADEPVPTISEPLSEQVTSSAVDPSTITSTTEMLDLPSSTPAEHSPTEPGEATSPHDTSSTALPVETIPPFTSSNGAEPTQASTEEEVEEEEATTVDSGSGSVQIPSSKVDGEAAYPSTSTPTSSSAPETPSLSPSVDNTVITNPTEEDGPSDSTTEDLPTGTTSTEVDPSPTPLSEDQPTSTAPFPTPDRQTETESA